MYTVLIINGVVTLICFALAVWGILSDRKESRHRK